MGWTNSHLHEFVIEGKRYGVPAREFDMEDVGDDWDHRLMLEAILPADPAARYPILIDGKNACPPEDVGGADGYCEFVAAVTNPAHKEHAEVLEWCGGRFNPYAFDLAKINALLEPLRR